MGTFQVEGNLGVPKKLHYTYPLNWQMPLLDMFSTYICALRHMIKGINCYIRKSGNNLHIY